MASWPLEAISHEYPSELTTFERMSRMIGSSSTIRTLLCFWPKLPTLRPLELALVNLNVFLEFLASELIRPSVCCVRLT